MQAQKGYENLNMLSTIKKIYKTEGFIGYYRYYFILNYSILYYWTYWNSEVAFLHCGDQAYSDLFNSLLLKQCKFINESKKLIILAFIYLSKLYLYE